MMKFLIGNYYINLRNLKKNNLIIKYKNPDYSQRYFDKKILVLGTGPSLFNQKDKIIEFIKKNNPVVIACNNIPNDFQINYRIFSNRARFVNYSFLINESHQLILSPYFKKKLIKKQINEKEYLYTYYKTNKSLKENFKIKNGVISFKKTANVGFLAILTAYIMGSNEISIAGIDGHYKDKNQHYYNEINDPKDINLLLEKDLYLKELFNDIKKFFRSNNVSFYSLTETKYDN